MAAHRQSETAPAILKPTPRSTYASLEWFFLIGNTIVDNVCTEIYNEPWRYAQHLKQSLISCAVLKTYMHHLKRSLISCAVQSLCTALERKLDQLCSAKPMCSAWNKAWSAVQLKVRSVKHSLKFFLKYWTVGFAFADWVFQCHTVSHWGSQFALHWNQKVPKYSKCYVSKEHVTIVVNQILVHNMLTIACQCVALSKQYESLHVKIIVCQLEVCESNLKRQRSLPIKNMLWSKNMVVKSSLLATIN